MTDVEVVMAGVLLKVRRGALVACAAAATVALGACTPEPSAPPSNVVVPCSAQVGRTCSTGALQSSSGTGQGTVTLNDGGVLSGDLVAAVAPATVGCAEFSPIGSEELDFSFTQTNGASTVGLTKTAVFSEQIVTELPADSFDVCFSSDVDFPAYLPSEFGSDLDAGDFSHNTVQIAVDGQPDQFTGLLLSCDLGYGVPCIAGRTLTPVSGMTQRLTVTVDVPVGDPKVRF